MRISMKQATIALDDPGRDVDSGHKRLTGLDGETICDLILLVGENCQRLLDAKVKNVKPRTFRSMKSGLHRLQGKDPRSRGHSASWAIAGRSLQSSAKRN